MPNFTVNILSSSFTTFEVIDNILNFLKVFGILSFCTYYIRTYPIVSYTKIYIYINVFIILKLFKGIYCVHFFLSLFSPIDNRQTFIFVVPGRNTMASEDTIRINQQRVIRE